jgi:hypothetical protein
LGTYRVQSSVARPAHSRAPVCRPDAEETVSPRLPNTARSVTSPASFRFLAARPQTTVP